MKSRSSKSPGVQGEGNYASAKKYNEHARSFAQSGRSEQAAKDAEPRDSREAEEMRRAEAEGRSHAKGARTGDGRPVQGGEDEKLVGEHPEGKNPIPRKIPGR